MTGELSADGKWQWNGSEWIPASTIPNPNENHLASTQQTSIQLNDSVIAGDVNIHHADAHEIAKVVHQSGSCPTCGNPNVAPIYCESVNCQAVFCFQCMQKYVHGRIVLENKFCEEHHKSEVDCLSLDDDFEHWEAQVKLQLTSLKYSESLLNNAPTIRLITAFTGIGFSGIGFVEDSAYIGLGLMLVIIALLFSKIMSGMIGASSKKLALLKQQMPENNPPGRPVIAGRNVPNFTEGSVRDFLYQD